jgi:hypothetical protein
MNRSVLIALSMTIIFGPLAYLIKAGIQKQLGEQIAWYLMAFCYCVYGGAIIGGYYLKVLRKFYNGEINKERFIDLLVLFRDYWEEPLNTLKSRWNEEK